MEEQLPISQLESLRFKATKILDSIGALQRTLDIAVFENRMPPWPEMLGKYNILLSQTHSLSASLIPALTSSQSNPQMNNTHYVTSPFEAMAIHPKGADDLRDPQVLNLLRTQQILPVLENENETIRRLSQHMATRGSAGVLSNAPLPPGPGPVVGGRTLNSKPEYTDVLEECREIREAHDARVERAVRAVALLRDKYEWKMRVEVEEEEPEELSWDPR